MCLAVYKPAGVPPDWEAYREGFRCNSHGAGFAVVDSGSVKICKGFFSFDDFRSAFEPYADSQAAIHFRLATHGERDSANCHPFRVTDDLAMIHNGVLSIACNVNKAMSDTWHYVELVLRPMAHRDADFYRRPDVKFMGESAIKGNKFVFLRGDGGHAIWNESSGHWSEDAWWSNDSYKTYSAYWSRPAIGFWRQETNVQPPESEYQDFLVGEAREAYDTLLEHGFTADDLDAVLRDEGEECLIQYAEDCEYAEEEGLWTNQ